MSSKREIERRKLLSERPPAGSQGVIIFADQGMRPDNVAVFVSRAIDEWIRENAPVKVVSSETQLERHHQEASGPYLAGFIYCATVSIIFEYLPLQKPTE